MPTISGLPAQSGGLTGDEEFPAERDGLTFKFTIDDLAAFIQTLITALDIDTLPTQSGAIPASAKIVASVGGTELQFTVQDILNLTSGSFDIDALPAQSGALPASAKIAVSIGGTELQFTVQDILNLTSGSFDIDALPAQSGALPASAKIAVSIGGIELQFTVQDILDLTGAVDAGTLTGATLASNVLATSITSTSAATYTQTNAAASTAAHNIRAAAGQAAAIEVAGNNGTPGVDSVVLNQSSAGVGFLWNRFNAAFNIGVNSITYLTMASTGALNLVKPTSGNSLTIGQVSGSHGVNLTDSLIGSRVRIQVTNTSNSASSDATLNLLSGGSSGGDPFIGFDITATQSWNAGVDNSDDDAFVIGTGGTPGATNVVRWSRTNTEHSMQHRSAGNTMHNTGFLEIPQNSQSASYTLVLADSGKHIYHPGADTTARTWTIPANSSVAYPVGTVLDFINDTGAGAITISITTDTLVLAGAGTTGSRTLAASGMARAVKMTATRWMITDLGGLT